MEKVFAKLLGLLLAAGIGLGPVLCLAQMFPQPDPKPSVGESITSGFKRGMNGLGNALKPSVTPATPQDDPVALSGNKKPKAATYAAVARLYERTGRLSHAADSYQKALSNSPEHLAALLGLARVKSRQGEPQAALKLYGRATKIHPNQPSVYNNLGAFYGSRGTFQEALGAMNRAVELQPKQPNYRANIAVILVHLGRTEEAFGHLATVHGDAVAHYNVGFLLNGEGQTEAARGHFQAALRADPSLQAARYWLDRLTGPAMQAQSPAAAEQPALRIGNRPNPQSRGTRRPALPARSGAAARQLPPPPRSSSWRPQPGSSYISDSPRGRAAGSLPERLPPTGTSPSQPGPVINTLPPAR